MQIETYELVENDIQDQTPEINEEALQLIEKLGLTGQQELITKPGEGSETRDLLMPYPEATGEQIFVFRSLCPEQVVIDRYKRTAIPLRVLQVAAHADSLGFFDEIQVWDVRTHVEKDPVLVGIKKQGQYNTPHYYLLARWGTELDDWGTMLTRAVEVARSNLIEHMRKVTAKAKLDTEAAKNATAAFFIKNGHDYNPSYNSWALNEF